MDFHKSECWILKDYKYPFKVEVKHWVSGDGKNQWNVYAYLFQAFPNFENLKECIGADIPVSMNWGNTYCKWDRDKNGEVTCKTYGSDYKHIHQERFEEYSTREDAFEVFEDAEYNWKELEECITVQEMK